ncbi:MAG: hypothetical protein JNM09_16440 [Blastocatellia bacterium]|nr:hypothetical protein [Blastocatellia bacterium]
MVLKFRCYFLLVTLLLVVLLSGCKGALLGEPAVVISEKMEVRNSTARVSRPVGNLKRGDQVTIVDRVTESEINYAHIQGPDNLDGWAVASNLATQANLEKAKELAATIAGVPVQAECRSGASVKLRLTPDRTIDDNFLVLLPKDTAFEIYDRETRPKPVDPKAADATGTDAGSENEAKGANYEIWYKVKPKDNPIVPAGYVYGGSVKLDVPYEILHFAHPQRRIVGWQRLGAVKDDRGQDNYHYVIFQKAYNQADEKSDFDYFQIIGFDPKNRSVSYYNVMRKEIRGTFPVTSKIEEKRASFQFKSLSNTQAEMPAEFSILTDDRGRVRVPPDQNAAVKK